MTKIGHLWKLDPGNVSNQIGQHKKYGKHTSVPVKIGEHYVKWCEQFTVCM
jgi:hypothetical protein